MFKKYLMAGVLAFLSVGLVHAGDEWRPLSSTEFKGGKIIIMTDMPADEQVPFGPVLFTPRTAGSESGNYVTDNLASQLDASGYLTVPASVYDKITYGEDLGRALILNNVVYAGSWTDFIAQNEANAEKSGSVVDGGGIVRGIFSVVAYSAALLVGAPITAVADQVLTNGKGNIFKDDPAWFKSLEIDPAIKANPPQGVIAMKTVGQYKGKNRVSVWTLVLLNQDPTGKSMPVAETSTAISQALAQLMKPKDAVTDDERAGVDRIKAKIVAERQAAEESLKVATSTVTAK